MGSDATRSQRNVRCGVCSASVCLTGAQNHLTAVKNYARSTYGQLWMRRVGADAIYVQVHAARDDAQHPWHCRGQVAAAATCKQPRHRADYHPVPKPQ